MPRLNAPIGRVWCSGVLCLAAAVATAAVSGQEAKPSPGQPRPPLAEGQILPEVEVQAADYADARKEFKTKLVRDVKAPGKFEPMAVPEGVSEVEYTSGSLKLRAWMNIPATNDGKRPGVLFLHGGFAFGLGDWEMTRPYREAGFVVMLPLLRGENGLPGRFSLYYDEVEDVLAAAEYLGRHPSVDAKQVHVAGHSVGGTLALLAAMTSARFRSASSFSASPDQVLYCKHGISQESIPFDTGNPREYQMRSPMAYAASFKCPARMYYGANEPHFQLSTERTAAVAKEHKLDVEAAQVEGGHESAVPEAMKRSIEFIRRK